MLKTVDCPRCRARQKFGIQQREIGPDEYELFIQCYYCRWKDVVITGNRAKIKRYKKLQKIKGRNLIKYGQLLQKRLDE